MNNIWRYNIHPLLYPSRIYEFGTFEILHKQVSDSLFTLQNESFDTILHITFEAKPPSHGRYEIIMTPRSVKVHQMSESHELAIVNAVPLEFPFIIAERANSDMVNNFCTLRIENNDIIVDIDSLCGSSLGLLLDSSKCCKIENVEFSVFLEFLKSYFGHHSDHRKKYNISTCRKLMDLHQRYSFDKRDIYLEPKICHFYNSDFYSATNLFCVVGTLDAMPNEQQRKHRAYEMQRIAQLPPEFGKSFSVKREEINESKLFRMFDLNWRFYTCIEEINNIEYLGIGITVYSNGERYWRQPAELQITIKTNDSRFFKKLKISREFNHTQSSVGCPVIAKIDGTSWDYLIVHIQAKKKFNSVAEFPGVKDITLVIEDKKIITSKNLLIHHFDYFKTLFESHFEDKNQKELVLHDVKYSVMYNIIDVIYNRSKFLTVDELEEMLILADRFFCPYIVQYVDIAIADLPINGIARAHVPIPIEEKIHFAEKYDQLVCVKECVKRATNPFCQNMDAWRNI